MNISKKVTLLFVFVGLLIIIFISGLIQDRIEKSEILENKMVQKGILNLYNVIYQNSEYLKKIAYEYQRNESIMQYTKTNNSTLLYSYLKKNNRMEELNLSTFLVLNSEKKMLFGESFDINSKEFLSIPEELLHFLQTHNLTSYTDTSKQTFYMNINYEKAIFHIRKLFDMQQKPIGYLFFARTIDATFLSDISEMLQDYVSLIPSFQQKNFDLLHTKKNTLEYNIVKDNEHYLLTYIKLYDEFEQKPFFISMKSKRDIYEEIKSNMDFVLICVCLCLMVIVAIFYLFMKILFSNRILNITNTVKEVSLNNELEVIIEDDYNDEITYLARKLNEMFASIDAKQHEKLKQERDFLQSVLDTQQNIIVITNGEEIHRVNRKFVDIFKSEDAFLSNIALLDNQTQKNLLNIAKEYSSSDKPAKFKLLDNDNIYFTFDVCELDMEQYLICMNDVSTLNKKISHLEVKATTDDLTKILNKVAIKELTLQWLNTKNFHLIVFDIDFFKKVNDTYGHLIGDFILRDTVKIIRKNSQQKDHIGRVGGEEFMILLDEQDKGNAIAFCERLRYLIEKHTFKYDNHEINITISMGITHSNLNERFDTIYKRADEALYEAKRNGRNQVVYH